MHKCINCDKISYTQDDLICECTSPNFIKCEEIHLLHKEGSGRLVGSRTISIGIPPVIRKEPLNLCCNTKQISPIATGYYPSITCKKCLDFIHEYNEALKEDEDFQNRTADILDEDDTPRTIDILKEDDTE